MKHCVVLLVATALVLGGVTGARLWNTRLDRMIGQMLLMGTLGRSADSSWAMGLARRISLGRVGGVVFLGHNFKTQKGVKSMTALFARAAPGLPVFLALDMEGGFVQRLGKKLGYEAIAPAQEVAETMTVKAARPLFARLARFTREAGFNVNLAPVVDILANKDNPVVGKWQRSFGEDPEKVAAYARAFIEEHRKRGVLSVLKHFPGHGSSLSDSHDGFVDITATWTKRELEPFAALIASGHAGAIMPGHLINRALTGGNVPVSLSQKAISGMLRGEMKFTGLVISDDLQMSAIVKNYTFENAVVRAINAGVDLLMITNAAKPDRATPEKTIAIIKKAIADGRIDVKLIRAAYMRIMAVREKLASAKGLVNE